MLRSTGRSVPDNFSRFGMLLFGCNYHFAVQNDNSCPNPLPFIDMAI